MSNDSNHLNPASLMKMATVATSFYSWLGLLPSTGKLPSSICRLIEDERLTVTRDVTAWKAFHNSWIFHDKLNGKKASQFYREIVWRSDVVTVCWERTAKKILQSGQLDIRERYRMACYYCDEQEVYRLRPLLRDSSSFRKEERSSSILDYWKKKMNNELEEWDHITRLFIQEEIWSAVEYFWDNADSNMQQMMFNMYALVCTYDFTVKKLYYKLSTSQLNELFNLEGSRMIVSLLRKKHCLSFGLELWTSKNDMMPDRCSYSVMIAMMKAIIDSCDRLPKRYVFFELWNLATNRVRSSLLRNLVLPNASFEDIFESRDSILFRVYFVMAVLSDVLWFGDDCPLKTQWRRLFEEIGVKDFVKPVSIQWNESEVEVFVNGFLKRSLFLKYSVEMIRELLIDDLNIVLRVFLRNPADFEKTRIDVFRRSLNQTDCISSLIFKTSCREQLDEVVNTAFQDAGEIMQFKINFVLAFGKIQILFSQYSRLIEFVEWFIPPEALSRCKKALLQSLDVDYFSYRRDIDFRRFLVWCSVDEYE